jgi:phospholipase/carboxylesterase
MIPIKSTLIHKVLKPQRKSPGKSPALILLHGRGANEDDLLGLAEFLDERLMIISPRAPFSFHYGGGYAWYEIEEVAKPEKKMFADSYQRLVQFIADVKTGYPVDSEKVFLGGFSMGTMMSYAFALTHPAEVRGIIANSGYVPEDTDLTFSWNEIKAKPFFVSHGTYDPVIPISFAKRAKELLEKAQADITYREYDMGHQISEENLNDMMNWMSGHL